jgi:hypothetical protein
MLTNRGAGHWYESRSAADSPEAALSGCVGTSNPCLTARLVDDERITAAVTSKRNQSPDLPVT